MSGDYFKRFATMQALAALHGVELRATRNDLERWLFVATLGAITTELDSLEAVAAWLDRLTVTEGQSA